MTPNTKKIETLRKISRESAAPKYPEDVRIWSSIVAKVRKVVTGSDTLAGVDSCAIQNEMKLRKTAQIMGK